MIIMTRGLLLLLFLFKLNHAMSQTPKTNYTALWKKVDDLASQKGLPKSALAEVNKIKTVARKEKEEAQYLKALVYIADMQESLQEEASLNTIREMESELKTAIAPAKQLLHSLLATRYHQYLQENRWQFYNRTRLADPGAEQTEDLDLESLQQRISNHYVRSLEQPSLLQKTGLTKYEPIIIRGKDRKFRPTLYDLLAHQALEFFEDDETMISRPARRFQMDDPAVFADARSFSAHRFHTPDSSSLPFRVLLIYQELLRFHLDDKDPSALLDADLKRLRFAYEKSSLADRETRYMMSLDKVYTSYPTHEWGMLAYLDKLELQEQRAQGYQPGVSDPSLRFALRDIHQELKKLRSKADGKTASARISDRIRMLENRDLSGKTEQVVVPGKPFLARIAYKNLDAVHYRIISGEKIQDRDLEHRDSMWSGLVRRKAIRQVKQALPDAGDMRPHSVEIGIEGLPAGVYALLCSEDESFSLRKQLSVQLFHVTSISYISQGQHYFVLNRETGEPLPGADLKAMVYRYDSREPGGQKYQEVFRGTTNSNGYLKLNLPERTYNFSVDLGWKGERLFTRNSEYFYRNGNRDPVNARPSAYFFTDRSIYRPGQVVHFKGIVLRTNGQGAETVEGFHTVVVLYDANGQKKDSLTLKTNRYGSIHGSFRIPEGLLTGNWQIRSKEGGVSIQVEEYKRPGFEVRLDDIKEMYRLGDSVRVNGEVRAYAGNTLNGARLSYRVVRRSMPIWPWWRGWPGGEGTQEISSGETVADARGRFEIPFLATADESINRNLSPRFTFEIEVNATDNSGETRSSSKWLNLGYQSLQLDLGLTQASFELHELKQLNIKARNADGQEQQVAVDVRVAKLNAPQRLLRERYWEAPDTTVMSREEFIQKFPFDPYMNEDRPETWETGKTVFNTRDSTGTVPLKDLVWEAGYYTVEVTAIDRFGDTVKDHRIISMHDVRNNRPAKPEYSFGRNQWKAEPGQTIQPGWGSSAGKVHVIRLLDTGNEQDPPFQLLSLNGGYTEMPLPVTEQQRGGVGLIHAFVLHNRFHSVNQIVEVPWSNKQLDVKVETFRDKLLPGAKETWKLTVSGSKGEKMASELLTSLYDASLDQFLPHQWSFPDLFRSYAMTRWMAGHNFTEGRPEEHGPLQGYVTIEPLEYDGLIWRDGYRRVRVENKISMAAAPMEERVDGVMMKRSAAADSKMEDTESAAREETDAYPGTEQQKSKIPPSLRTNFNETAFFFPDLTTDAEGNVSFTFTMPESLTRWKWQVLAHTPDLKHGSLIRELVTQKDLMIQPNFPRFLREGDDLRVAARVSNLSALEMTGQARLELIDAETGQSVDGWFQNIFPTQFFTLEAGQTQAVSFQVRIPSNYNKPLRYRITANSGKNSDGEENILPVLTNRVLVTESIPLMIRGNEERSFDWKGLRNSSSSSTITHERITVEFSTNPAWYAVLALPYLMEFPYECSEQVFNRFYANALASSVANSAPAIRQIFDQWKNADSAALISNLQKNPQLRNLLLEQTPWVLQAKNESERRRNIALLFDLVRMGKELGVNLEKLRGMQMQDGAFPWFQGGRDDRYITQYILAGLGRLRKLGAYPASSQQLLVQITGAALGYADRMITRDLQELKKNKTDLAVYVPGALQVQYLYIRSFEQAAVPKTSAAAYQYFLEQAKKTWVKQGLLQQGMIALVSMRQGDQRTAAAIIKSLKERTILAPEQGRYWKSNARGWYWYQSPIETHSLLTEAFHEWGKDPAAVEELKLWLLNQKRVQDWETTTATADAVYALLRTGGQMLTDKQSVALQLGSLKVNSDENKQEAGTGYFSLTIPGNQVLPEMGNIRVKTSKGNGNSISWGAVHWQYFEQMDKVRRSGGPVSVNRSFFLERNSEKGPQLVAIREGDVLKPGDKIRVRIQLKADRDMEYMHLKDQRVSGTEPVNVLSTYRWQGGLGYYEATRDASTDFFFPWLPKGNWILEYPVFVTHEGNFAAGFASLQSMYAPEFNANSSGSRLEVRDND